MNLPPFGKLQAHGHKSEVYLPITTSEYKYHSSLEAIYFELGMLLESLKACVECFTKKQQANISSIPDCKSRAPCNQRVTLLLPNAKSTKRDCLLLNAGGFVRLVNRATTKLDNI